MQRSLRLSRIARAAVAVGGGKLVVLLVLGLALVPRPAVGQEGDSPARFIPRDELVVFVEFQGVDAHVDAWHQTAAYRMLSETSLGELLEQIGIQVTDYLLTLKPPADAEPADADADEAPAPAAPSPARRPLNLAGTEVIDALQHALRSGFAVGVGGGQSLPSYAVLVVRGGAGPEARPLFGRLLGLLIQDRATQAELTTKADGRHVVVITQADGQTYAWWAEGEDLVLTLDRAETADVVIETLDGHRLNAVEHPLRSELLQPEGGFRPCGIAFLDLTGSEPPLAQLAELGLDRLERLDCRWGFQDEALMSLVRIAVPSPREGILALLDQPPFGKEDLPPIPSNVPGFTVASFDGPTTFDRLRDLAGAAGPDAEAAFDQAVESLQGRSRLNLRDDLLAQIGPKVAFYFASRPPAAEPDSQQPPSPYPPGAAATAAPTADATNPTASLMDVVRDVSRFALVVEIDDPEAFDRTLDELVLMINERLRDLTPGLMVALPEEDDPPASREAPRREPLLAFRGIPGARNKTFVLRLPAILSPLAPTIRPTLMMGQRHLVLANSADAAREVLAAEADQAARWSPSGAFGPVFNQLPDQMTFLSVSDRRETMPALLTRLPRTIEDAVNQATAGMQQEDTAAETSPNQGGGAQPGIPPRGPQAGGFPPGGFPPGGSAPGGFPPGGSAPGGFPPGGSAPGGFAGAPAPGAGATPGPTRLTLNIAPDMIPAADELRRYLFPGATAVTVDDEGLRILWREPFPGILSATNLASSAILAAIALPAAQSVREAVLGVPGVAGALPPRFPAPGGGPAGDSTIDDDGRDAARDALDRARQRIAPGAPGAPR